MKEQMNQPPLYARLGINLESDIALGWRLKMLRTCLEGGVDPQIYKRSTIGCRQQVVLAYHLLGQQEEALEHAAALVAEVEDFLTGDWLDSHVVTRWVEDPSYSEGGYKKTFIPGRNWCRREFHWMEAFRDGLLWALWMNDHAAALRLAEYPGADVPEQEFDYGPADKACMILAASLLLERPRQGWVVHEQVIERTRAKKPRLILAALRAISSCDTTAFRKAISECIRHHVRTSSAEPSLDSKLALDASLVLGIAEWAGMSTDLLPSNYDHVVVRSL